MQIEIPDTQTDKLARIANAAGFDNVEDYIIDFIAALAEQEDPQGAAAFVPLSRDELAESLSTCNASMKEIEAGGGMSLEEARRRAHEDLRKRI